jgi:molybdenum cofactor synthesis domain-containing protein
MKKLRVQDAVGQTLCHDMTAIIETGFKGVKFKRGHVITEEDIPQLLNMGKEHIFAWEPEADEVHEDDSAVALTEAMCGENISYTGPSEGKMQINSDIDGVFCLNSKAMHAINSVPDYTVACLPGYMPVKKGQKLAGARIVPLVTKRENVDKAVAIAEENFPVMTVAPYRALKTGVVITGSEVYYGRIKDAFQPILTEKLEAYGAEILGFTKCPDDQDMIISAVNAFLEQGAELILLTGGMSVDPDDLTPTAIRMTGAKVVTQGFPMQPGNMLTVAYLGKTALIGVPGASMHSKVTSLDVFLPRVFAGIELKSEDVAGFGEGGFCMGCKECTWPKCYFGFGGK